MGEIICTVPVTQNQWERTFYVYVNHKGQVEAEMLTKMYHRSRHAYKTINTNAVFFSDEWDTEESYSIEWDTGESSNMCLELTSEEQVKKYFLLKCVMKRMGVPTTHEAFSWMLNYFIDFNQSFAHSCLSSPSQSFVFWYNKEKDLLYLSLYDKPIPKITYGKGNVMYDLTQHREIVDLIINVDDNNQFFCRFNGKKIGPYNTVEKIVKDLFPDSNLFLEWGFIKV